jgi:hypothetical protein
MGRPSYQPTDEDRTVVGIMAAAGLLHDRIAARLKISKHTLEKHFRAELDQGLDAVTTLAVGQLVQKIRSADLGAICFWLKCRAGWRETERIETRQVDKDGNDVKQADYADVRKYLQSLATDAPR